jgi:hypothetical protein
LKTRKSFYRALRNVAAQFNWTLDAWDCLRGYDKTTNKQFCPITAVAYSRGSQYLRPGQADKAAELLKLPAEEMDIIIGGADGVEYEENRKRAGKALRRAVGLSTS